MTATEVVSLARSLYAEGLSSGALNRQIRCGTLHRVRHGAYATEETTDPAVRHLRLIAGTLPRLRRPAVVSHFSAAVLHELPVWGDDLGRVHLTRTDPRVGRVSRNLHVHTGDLSDADVVERLGIAITSLGRTAADVARTTTLERSVAVVDAALRLGLTGNELQASIPTRQVEGVGQLRWVADFADARSESVGESFSRFRINRLGLPAPEPQYLIVDPVSGRQLARSDFGWPEFRTLGEFDGQIKYGRLLAPGDSPGDVVYREKIREDMLRDLGWEVVRWVWADLGQPAVMRERLHRAFARGLRNAA